MDMKFKYDTESGCAYIGDASRKVKFSMGLLDAFVIDFDFNHKVTGVEIIDAKDVLDDFNIDINKIKKVRITTRHTENYFVVTLIFTVVGGKREISIPLTSQIAKSIKN